YQEIKAGDIPEVTDDDGTLVRLVCGQFWGKRGPVEGIAADPTYLDVSVPAGKRKTLPVETTRHAFAYVFGGSGKFCNASEPLAVPTEGAGWGRILGPPAVVATRSWFWSAGGEEVVVQGGRTASAFSSSPGSRFESPSPGMGRS